MLIGWKREFLGSLSRGIISLTVLYFSNTVSARTTFIPRFTSMTAVARPNPIHDHTHPIEPPAAPVTSAIPFPNIIITKLPIGQRRKKGMKIGWIIHLCCCISLLCSLSLFTTDSRVVHTEYCSVNSAQFP